LHRSAGAAGEAQSRSAHGTMPRYNDLGEWKPFASGGDEAYAKSAARQLAADDMDTYDALFYVFYTGHHAFEFVALTTVSLPIEQLDLADNRFHLWRCPPAQTIQNEIVYDGWWDLERPDPEEVRSAFRAVGQILNRLAFTFRSKLQWRPKYRSLASAGSYLTPDASDLTLMDRYLSLRASAEENAVLDSAIDWYNRAQLAANPFSRFLSYYIPFEVVALAIGNSTASFGIGAPKPDRTQRRKNRKRCIQDLHQELFSDDPIGFVERAYFECIGSIRRHLESALVAIFGQDAPEVQAVVGRSGPDPSLMELRSKIAHGDYSFSNSEHVRTIKSRTPDLARISRSFIVRLLLKLSPTDPLPTWSGRGRAAIGFDDPRDVHMVSPQVLESRDWTIRPEWCTS
jgi:hypothetical protein